MSVYACLIVGSLHLHHDTGDRFDLNVSTVRYVRAGNETAAKAKSIAKFLADKSFGGDISNAEMTVEKLRKVRPWALWSRTAWFGWEPQNPDQTALRADAVGKTLEYHRHIS